MLVEKQTQSIYAGGCDVDEQYCRKLISAAIQRHGGKFDGATLVNVIEDDEGVVQAFLMASLTRVYGIGKLLTADTGPLVATEKAPAGAMDKLLNAYIKWARSNSKVYEIDATWTDILPTGPRMDKIFERKGFEKCGGIYRRIMAADAVKEAA